jgi:hypothetical protein
MKIPIRDNFDQLNELSSIDDTQFQKVANFFLSNPKQQVEPFSIRKIFDEVSSYYNTNRYILIEIESRTCWWYVLVEWPSTYGVR